MSSGDLLGTGISALLAFQRSLSTTSHNISNVNTDGYSRQLVSLGARLPQGDGTGFIGTGVQAITVLRQYSNFISSQVLTNSTASTRLDSYYQYAKQVDNLLADANTGLAPGLQEFFGAVQDVATDPTAIPARQVLISQGQSLVDRFHTLDTNLNTLNQSINTNLSSEVVTINSLGGSIAKLNNDISIAAGSAGGQPPNDLLDQRDALIEQLSLHVSVATITQDDGSINIFIGNGQNLVIGNQSAQLSVTANQYDAQQGEITVTMGGTSSVATSKLTGGSIGGSLDFRAQILNPARNELGRVAIALSQTLNAQHQAGMDLNGTLGQALFTPPAPQILASSSNGAGAAITVAVSDVGALTKDDYLLQYNGTNYLLTNMTTNSTQTLGAAGTYVVDGLTLDVATANSGDRFLILPTRAAAGGISLAISDPRSIAAATPIATATTAANTGNGRISAGTVTDISNTAFTTTTGVLTPPITIRFTSAVAYDVINTTTSAVLDSGVYNPVTGNNIFPTTTNSLDYGYQVRITGAPATGDTFTVDYNTNGTGDNRNALALAGLQTSGVLSNGTTTYGESYGNLVSSIGAQTHSADINLQSQTTLLQQSKDQRASVSGVNLDEEAANMLRFQQAYQAAAQVISIASSLFGTLLGALRG